MARNLKDAFYNAQFRVGQGIFTRAVSQGDNSLTESNFTGIDTFDTLIEDDTGALPEFVDSQISMSDAASNGVAINKISASQTAMDAVAASQTAMNAVAGSLIGRTTILESQYTDSLWSNSTGSQAYWDGFESEITSINTNPFTINFPTNSLGGVDLEVVNSGRGADEKGFAGRTYNLDLSSISQLTVYTTGSNFQSSCPLVVQVGGTNVLEISSSHNDVQRNIDVSSYSGTQEVGFGLDYQGATASQTTVVHSRIELS